MKPIICLQLWDQNYAVGEDLQVLGVDPDRHVFVADLDEYEIDAVKRRIGLLPFGRYNFDALYGAALRIQLGTVQEGIDRFPVNLNSDTQMTIKTSVSIEFLRHINDYTPIIILENPSK